MRLKIALVPLVVAALACGGAPDPAPLVPSAPPTPARVPFSPGTFSAADAQGLAFEGALEHGLAWTDAKGANLLLLTRGEAVEKPPPEEGTDPPSERWLYAYHYRRAPGGPRELVRLVKDFEGDCPFDLTVEHLPEAAQVTDLDRDDLGEVTFAYVVNCTSDVSPVGMKLMLLEDGQKYAVRGTRAVRPGPEGWIGGEAELDAAFDGAPPAFREHVLALWDTLDGRP